MSTAEVSSTMESTVSESELERHPAPATDKPKTSTDPGARKRKGDEVEKMDTEIKRPTFPALSADSEGVCRSAFSSWVLLKKKLSSASISPEIFLVSRL